MSSLGRHCRSGSRPAEQGSRQADEARDKGAQVLTKPQRGKKVPFGPCTTPRTNNKDYSTRFKVIKNANLHVQVRVDSICIFVVLDAISRCIPLHIVRRAQKDHISVISTIIDAEFPARLSRTLSLALQCQNDQPGNFVTAGLVGTTSQI